MRAWAAAVLLATCCAMVLASETETHDVVALEAAVSDLSAVPKGGKATKPPKPRKAEPPYEQWAQEAKAFPDKLLKIPKPPGSSKSVQKTTKQDEKKYGTGGAGDAKKAKLAAKEMRSKADLQIKKRKEIQGEKKKERKAGDKKAGELKVKQYKAQQKKVKRAQKKAAKAPRKKQPDTSGEIKRKAAAARKTRAKVAADELVEQDRKANKGHQTDVTHTKTSGLLKESSSSGVSRVYLKKGAKLHKNLAHSFYAKTGPVPKQTVAAEKVDLQQTAKSAADKAKVKGKYKKAVLAGLKTYKKALVAAAAAAASQKAAELKHKKAVAQAMKKAHRMERNLPAKPPPAPKAGALAQGTLKAATTAARRAYEYTKRGHQKIKDDAKIKKIIKAAKAKAKAVSLGVKKRKNTYDKQLKRAAKILSSGKKKP